MTNGLYRFRYVIPGGNACPSNQSETTVKVVQVAPSDPEAGPNHTVCSNTVVYMAGNASALNEVGTWIVTNLD